MKRRRLLAALAAPVAVAAFAGCTPSELNRWGAWARGATVETSYRGHPYYVTGYATASYDTCIWMGIEDASVPDWVLSDICQVNRTWVEGDHGYRS